ncbi:hypothetical protein GGR51DRAFT_562113 [Nemania sp. FL0031]|nr:hypothetical protein GGR51DRAFT_562113 [Nemania sp. FL0031]
MDPTGFALVTGGASGISKAVCITFASLGAGGVLVADINLEAAKATAAECRKVAKNPNFRAEAIHLDVVQEEAIQAAVDKALELFGRIDYCVNGAGVIGEACDIADCHLDTYKRTMDINVQGTFLMTRTVSKTMSLQDPVPVDEAYPARGITRGAIVNIGSIASYISLPKSAQYVTSKHAVLGLSRASALDNVPHNIRVNCVCPSWVDTPLVDDVVSQFPPLQEFILSQMPMGRMGLPQEIADVVVFLCSPRASWINGANIVVDGAMTVGVYTPSPPTRAEDN